MIGVALALLSSVTSGLSVVLVRRYSAGSNAFIISFIVTAVGMLVLWPLALFSTDFSLINVWGVILFAVSGVLSPGIVRLFYYRGLNELGASVNSSVFSVYPLYSAFLAVLFLNEVLFLQDWLGILLVVAGVIFVEASSRNINGGKVSFRHHLIFPILGGLTLGVGSIIRKYALDISDLPIFGVAVAYAFSLLPYILMLTFSNSTRKSISLKRDVRLFWTAGIGQAISWILTFYALSYTQVSVATPLFSTEPIFVVFFAYLYLRGLERMSHKILLSIILTMLGIVLITI